MAFKKTFQVSDESSNTHGFWTRTEGIDLSLAKKNCPCFYDHVLWEIPLGHWENHRIENGLYYSDLVIEGANDLEKEYIRKIQNGDLKCASFGADPKEWKNSVASPVDGIAMTSLWACEIYEISLLPLPSNKNSIALKNESSMVKLSANNVNTIIPNFKIDNMKQIALKLGLAETATESEIVTAIDAIQLAKKNSEAFQNEMLKDADKDLTEENKEVFIELSKINPAKALKFAQLNKKVDEAEVTEDVNKGKTTTGAVQKDVRVSALLKKGTNAASDDVKDSFDYLQKHNPTELSRIKKEDPNKYAQLAADYGKGVRYTGK